MNLEKMKRRLEQRDNERTTKLENQRLTLLNKINVGWAEFLCEFPSVNKIVVFGSLMRAGYFTELSDIDIAVKNLPNAKYWSALLWWEKRLGYEDIDLVRIEDANPHIQKYINKGEVVYEKAL